VCGFLVQFLCESEVEQSKSLKMVLSRESSSISLRSLVEFDLDVSAMSAEMKKTGNKIV
jgi:hypothetical protein